MDYVIINLKCYCILVNNGSLDKSLYLCFSQLPALPLRINRQTRIAEKITLEIIILLIGINHGLDHSVSLHSEIWLWGSQGRFVLRF